jgi:hypothetical protein
MEATLTMEQAVIGMITLTKRKGTSYTTGWNRKQYNGTWYSTCISYDSNQSKNYKDIVAFLKENNIPHTLKKVNRQRNSPKMFRCYDIEIIPYGENKKCLYCKEESTFDEETTECEKCGRYQDLYGEFSDDE